MVLKDCPPDTDRIWVCHDELLRLVAVQRRGAVHGRVALAGDIGWRNASPQNDTVRPRVARSDAVREAQLGRVIFDIVALPRSALDARDVDTEATVSSRGTGIVEISVKGGGSRL